MVGITIGTGVFLKSAAMAQAVGTPALVLGAWAVAGLVALLAALCFAELGRCCRMPGASTSTCAPPIGEVPGFLYACNSFLLGGASIAAYGAAVAIFISDIHAFGHEWFRYALSPVRQRLHARSFGARQLIAIGVIAVFAAINCAGVMLGGRVQTLLTVTKVIAILGVAAGVFLFSGTRDAANLAAAAGHGHRRLWPASARRCSPRCGPTAAGSTCRWPPARCASRSATCRAPSSAARCWCWRSTCW